MIRNYKLFSASSKCGLGRLDIQSKLSYLKYAQASRGESPLSYRSNLLGRTTPELLTKPIYTMRPSKKKELNKAIIETPLPKELQALLLSLASTGCITINVFINNSSINVASSEHGNIIQHISLNTLNPN